MNNATKQPVQVPTGGPYGSGVASAQAQQAVPLPQAGAASSPVLEGGGGPATGISPSGGPPSPDSAVMAAQGMPPINLNMGAPTDRPGEPITTGMAMGPGAGPIAPPDPLIMATASLNMLHPDQVDPDTARLMQAMNNHLMNRAAP